MAQQQINMDVLENNPEILKPLCENLNISERLKFYDLVSTSSIVLQETYPCPCHALIVLDEQSIYYGARAALEATIPEYQAFGPDESIIWMKQTIGHSCGLMALLHVVFKLESGRFVRPGTSLDTLGQQAIHLEPARRAQPLYDSEFLERAHMDAASRESSNVPSPPDDNKHHFLAFVQKDGDFWELNRGMNGPLLRGNFQDGEDLFSEKGLELTCSRLLDCR